jgi:hypothetical protein
MAAPTALLEAELAETETAMRRARMIEQDLALNGPVRKRLARYRRMATARPTLANAGLIELALELAAGLTRTNPKVALARSVSTQVFHRHHLDAETKLDLPTVAAFEAFVGALHEAGRFLLEHLSRTATVFPAKNSWLIPHGRIARLSGDRTCEVLQLDYHPPLIIFHMSLERLRATGVTVRVPRLVDSVAHDLGRWNPAGVPEELIDGDVPTTAVESVEWRP